MLHRADERKPILLKEVEARHLSHHTERAKRT